jgi:hypothetical protein
MNVLNTPKIREHERNQFWLQPVGAPQQTVNGNRTNLLHARYRIDYVSTTIPGDERPKHRYVAYDMQSGKIALIQLDDGKGGISNLFWEQYRNLPV